MKVDDLSSVTQSWHDYSSSFREDEEGTVRERTTAAPPLQGRDHEKLELFKVYQRVVQTEESQVVFVHGTSGQGKTSLIDTLRDPVCKSNGYFCAGKFFQDPGIQEPYSAITSAFSDLCDLVVQSPDFDEKSRDRIRECLVLDGHMLSRSINLSPFFSGDLMDPYPAKNSEEKNATFARFRAACKAFLLAMASKKHPVVLFLDDIQWMESGSRKLIDIMNDDDIKNVMLVFSYRDEEASAVEDILKPFQMNERHTDILLSDLGLQSVRQIVARKLRPMTSQIDELSELTFQRTGGNPYYVSLFLEALETKELIMTGGPCQRFDVDEIRRSMMVAESIADCLSHKVSRLPSAVKDVLAVASLIGYAFGDEVLVEVPDILKIASTDGETREKVLSLLTVAVDGGFIERYRGGYQFAHDKVQKSFQGLLHKPARERFHLLIGKVHLAKDDDCSIYNAVVHLNVAPGFLYCPEQVILLAGFNLNASQYCQQLSAYDKALSLLRKGIELLDSIKMRWSHEVLELSLDLSESLARVALLVGDFNTCFEATREAMLHVDTKEQKANLLFINVECRMANNEMEGSIKASTEALSKLGVNLPRKATMRHVIFKFMKLRLLMSGKTDDDILGLPPVQDAFWTVAIRLLMHITFYAVLINEEATGVYAALLAMDLTLKHGLSAYAAPALASFGIAYLHMGNIERAYELGKLSLKLMEQSQSREGDCQTLGCVNALLLHWKEPINDLCSPLLVAATAGFEKGDIIYSTYCISQVHGMDLINGIHLEVTERSLHYQYSRLHDVGQDELQYWVLPYMQYVATLRSSSTDWWQLALMSGEYSMDFNKHSLEGNASKNLMLVTATTLVLKGRLANAFGYHCLALETFEELAPFEHVLHTVFVFNLICWETSVACYESFMADGKRKHLRKARKYKKHLERRDALGPNASTFLRHLNLKEANLGRRGRKRTTTDSSRNEATLRLLDRELESFSLSDSRFSPCYVVARAFVDAGSIAGRMGRFDKALQYFERGKEIYTEQWGAVALAGWLDEKCRNHQPREHVFNTRNLLVGGIVQFGGGKED